MRSSETLIPTKYSMLYHKPENHEPDVQGSEDVTSHICRLTHSQWLFVYFFKYNLQCVKVSRYLSHYVQGILDGTCWNYELQMKQLFLLHAILSPHTTDHHLVSLYGKTSYVRVPYYHWIITKKYAKCQTNILSYNKNQRDALFLKFILV
jgi:hypothetical protein